MAKRHGRPSVQYRYEHYDPSQGGPVRHAWADDSLYEENR
jgi:hypothetical protein